MTDNATPQITPGSILGYRRDGRPIRLIAGASDDPAPAATDNGSDQDASTTPPDNGAQPETPAAAEDSDKPLGPNGEKALKREREARAAAEKASAELAAKLREFEDRDKTEAQKLADRLAEAEKAAQERATELSRYRVAAETGVPADLLVGGDEDAMRTHAEALKAYAAAQAASQRPPVPKPDLSQGSRSGAGTDLDARIAEAHSRGEWRTVMRLQNEKLAAAVVADGAK